MAPRDLVLEGGTEERRRRFLQGVSSLGLAGFLAGCGGSGDGGDGGGGSDGGDGEMTEGGGGGSDGGDGEMTEGDGGGGDEFEVIILYDTFPDILDPHVQSRSEIYSTLTAMIEYPFWLDQRESPPPFRPRLATDWGFVDDTTFEMTVREGVKWHSGDTLEPEDIAWSFRRIFDPDTGVTSDIQADWDFINSAEPEGNKVILNLENPDVLLPIKIGARLNIMNKSWAEERSRQEISRNVDGTGPYKLENFQEGVEIAVTPFEDWWQRDESLPDEVRVDPDPGFPDRISFRAATEASARANQIIAGEAHVARGINPEDWERINNSDNGQMKRFKIDRTAYVAMNDVKPPFDKPRVKQAFNHAIDRFSIVNDILDGAARPLASLQASQWPGFNDEIEPYEYNPEKAQELYDKSGAEQHRDLTLFWVPGLPKYREISIAIANFLNQNIEQIEVETEQVTGAGFDEVRKADGTHEGRERMWTATTGGSPPHNGPGKLGSYVYSEGHSSTVTDDTFDEMFEAVPQADTIEGANQRAKELHQYVHDNHFMVFLHQMQGAIGLNQNLDISIPANENMHPYLITDER